MLRTMHNASTGWSPADAPYPRYHIPDSRPQAFIYVYSTKSRLTDKYPTDDPAAFLGPAAPERGGGESRQSWGSERNIGIMTGSIQASYHKPV